MTKQVHRLSEKNPETGMAVCAECGPVKMKWVKHKNGWRCSVAHKLQKKMGTPGTHTKGIGFMSAKERAQRIEWQQGKCVICGEVKPLCRDHDHNTGLDRGFLCRSCNIGLGHFNDDPVLLRKAAIYVTRFKEMHENRI